MTSLDLIVRPFQSVNVTPPQAVRIAATAPENVVLQIGLEGEGKTFTGNFSSSESFYMGQHVKETSRKTSEKRIENPDDPDQFVMVSDIDHLDTKAGRGQQYQGTRYSFDNKGKNN